MIGYNGCVYDTGDPDEEKRFIKIGEITDEDAKAVRKFIDNASPINRIYKYGFAYDTMYGILEEESLRFFNGECTAEECAKVIQQRMSLFLSEQFG